MANCCVILGASGSGKSTSIKGLNPKETIIINILNKRLPFKGSSTVYNKENKNLFVVEDYNEVITLLKNIDKSAPTINNVVIDDAIYIMAKEFFVRAKEIGYTKFTELAQHFQQIINTCEKMRNNINIFLLLHSETVKNDNVIIGYKTRTIGKLLDDQYNLMEVVPMLLFAGNEFDDKGNAQFNFYTHKLLLNGVEIPAKTPEGMFEEDKIPNDLGIVAKAIKEYF